MAEYVNPRAVACQNCVKAKAKCYGHTNGKCERCNRLGRDCVMQAPVVRKRKAGKTTRHAQAGRIAELEQKLEGLVSLLGSSQAHSLGDSRGSSVFSPESANSPLKGFGSMNPILPDQIVSEEPEFRQADPTGTTPNLGMQPSILAMENPRNFETASLKLNSSTTAMEPEKLLAIFRHNLARQVPFVSLPIQVTAESLSKEKPFLYQAIIAVASYHDSVLHITLGQQFLKDFTEAVVLHGKRNLDLLQSLLVYISWYNYLLRPNWQTTTLLGIAFSLVIDLNLYLPLAISSENQDKFLVEMKVIVSSFNHSWGRVTEPTKEEKRAILGTFCLFSSISANFVRLNPLHWSPYIQHCYEDVLNSPENDNDIYLAHVANLLRISEDIRHSGIRSFPAQLRSWNAAVGVNFKLLLSDLQKFKTSLPDSLQQDALMMMHYHAVEMYLLDICFSMPPTTLTHTPSLQRNDVLLMCFAACKNFSDHYFSIDSKPYISFAPAVMSQMYIAMMTLSKLSLFEGEDWDVSNVQTSMDFSTLVERLATMLEDASERYDIRDDSKPWLQVSGRIRQVRVRFEHLLATEKPSCGAVSRVAQDGNATTTAGIPTFLSQFDLFDDGFWQSLPDDTAFMQ